MGKNKTGRKVFSDMGKRIMAGAAIIVIGTSTTVAASQEKGYFSEFFGGVTNSFVKDTENQMVVKSGIKMRIEESLSGGKSSLIIVSFENVDGTDFPEGAAISNLELDVRHGASYMVEQKLTEDRKKMIAVFDVDTSNSLEGKSIRINADDIVNGNTGEVIADGPFKNKFTAHDRSDKIDVDLTLKQQNEEVELQTLYVSAVGLGIEGSRKDGQTEYLPTISPKVMVMTSDDRIIELSIGSTSTTDIGFKWQYSLDPEGNRVFLNKSSIKSIIINDQIINID
jgi:hypothetical protein